MAVAAAALHPLMDGEADDIIEAFKKFKQKCNLAFKSFLKGVTPEEKVSCILLWTGDRGQNLFNSWELAEEEENNPERLIEIFSSHLEPRSNHRIKRYEFQGLKQEPDESVDNFLTRLKNIAAKCKLKEIQERIVDQLMWGSAHPEVQKALMGKDSLKLAAAVDAFEATKRQMQSLSVQANTQHSDRSVNAIKCTQRKLQTSENCKRCGRLHAFDNRKKCPAYGLKCRSCGKVNH
ncbi:uncharacterized protein [Narcine bancroftii]|uniref:uncharacterized protein n=1 Tax=Narcine bancroftii TaxID=1343680 RepID=UPI00383167F3